MSRVRSHRYNRRLLGPSVRQFAGLSIRRFCMHVRLSTQSWFFSTFPSVIQSVSPLSHRHPPSSRPTLSNRLWSIALSSNFWRLSIATPDQDRRLGEGNRSPTVRPRWPLPSGSISTPAFVANFLTSSLSRNLVGKRNWNKGKVHPKWVTPSVPRRYTVLPFPIGQHPKPAYRCTLLQTSIQTEWSLTLKYASIYTCRRIRCNIMRTSNAVSST